MPMDSWFALTWQQSKEVIAPFEEIINMLGAIGDRLFVRVFGLSLCLVGLGLCSAAQAADWPQWRGPNRDGICAETGLLESWPEGGPKLLWEIKGLGTGYSSLTIVDGKLYTMGDIEVESEKTQCVLAYDLSTRKRLWEAEVGPPHEDGPRCTPTVDDGLIYAIGTAGDLVCVDADTDTGKVRWSKNFQKDLSIGKNPGWKYSESPLVDGEKLLCTPGGRDAVMVALNKKTGELIWKCSMPDIGRKGKDEAGYSSIVVAETDGIRQYVQLTNKGLIGVAAKDGRFLWGYNKIANRVANISTPVISGEYVFCSTAYGTGSALLKLAAADNGVDAEEIYFLDDKTFQNHHGGFVRIGDYIYGGHGHGKGKPTCIEMKTGKVMWQQDQPGGNSAAVLYADGHLYFRYEDNVLALLEANPQKYNLKSTFKLPQREGMSGPGWAHLVIVDGKLYIRHSDVLLVYDIKAKK
jgi:outer membrane protein assembly factor BamB